MGTSRTKWRSLLYSTLAQTFPQPGSSLVIRALVISLRMLELTLITNGGPIFISQVADVKHFGEVWFNPNSLANILSLGQVADHFRTTFDSSKEDTIYVHLPNDQIMEFQREGKFYIYDTAKAGNSCLQTVKNNKLMFSRREVDLADKALALHRMLGYPGFEKMSNILDNDLVHNCPLRSSDFKRALQLYCKAQPMLQGKSTRQTPKNPVPVPAGSYRISQKRPSLRRYIFRKRYTFLLDSF